MENSPSSTTNSQSFIETPSFLVYEDPRRSTALRGFVMGLIGVAAFFAYIAIFVSSFFFSSVPVWRFISGFAIWGTLITTLVAPIFGLVFSIRGLKSITRKKFAVSGLILSLIPLALLLAVCSLAFLVAWSNLQP